VFQGHLYAIGGNDGTSSLDKCECYDPFKNKWTDVASMGNKRAGAGVGVLDGYIYAVGKDLVLQIFNKGAYVTFKSSIRPSIYFSLIVISHFSLFQ